MHMEPRRNGVVGGNSRPLFPIRQHWVAYPDHVTSPQARRSAPRQGTAHSPAGNAPPTPPLICCTSTISARRAVPPPPPAIFPRYPSNGLRRARGEGSRHAMRHVPCAPTQSTSPLRHPPSNGRISRWCILHHPHAGLASSQCTPVTL